MELGLNEVWDKKLGDEEAEKLAKRKRAALRERAVRELVPQAEAILEQVGIDEDASSRIPSFFVDRDASRLIPLGQFDSEDSAGRSHCFARLGMHHQMVSVPGPKKGIFYRFQTSQIVRTDEVTSFAIQYYAGKDDATNLELFDTIGWSQFDSCSDETEYTRLVTHLQTLTELAAASAE